MLERIVWLPIALLILVAVVLVNCDLEGQPKLRTRDGSLVIEAAKDRNITFRLSADSNLFFGDVNVLEEVRQLLMPDSRSNIDSGGANELTGIPSGTVEVTTAEALAAQVQAMKRDLQRLNRRLTTTQNRTNGRVQTRRLRRFLGRIRRVDTLLTQLETNIDTNECEQSEHSPCKNGGTCYDGYKNFHCECPEGWSGQTCEEDVNECYILTGTDLGCQNNGVCHNTPGSYRCECSNGFAGTHCRIRNATCELAESSEICGHGVCVHANNDPGYSCLCDQGWAKNNATPACVIDVDECAQLTNPCHSGCVNLPGTFQCEPCPRGYTGDGVTCTDVDECANHNGGCSLQPMVRCINTEGSYHCGNCPEGWAGDGRNCQQLQSNSCDAANICHPRAKCEYISGTTVCTCLPGLYGHGFGPNGCSSQANSTDPCENHVCKNNATCTVSGRGTLCICQPGYTGALCEQPDACQAHPCQNGGTCKVLPGNQFSCTCERGTTGKRCEILREMCGSIFRQETGAMSYPPSGGQYEPLERCAWMIRTADTKVLNVTFTKFDLEEPETVGGDCSKDWLQIHDGRALTAQLIGRFCGKTLPLGGHILSSHQQLFFWFRSDNTTHGGGFTMSWTSEAHSCGGNIELNEDDSGIIRSPGYPGKTPANRDCEWQLSAPFGYRFVLRVYEAVLGTAGGNCTRDTVKIYDADFLLKAICESSQPEPLHTSSNKATIHLHTDSYLEDSAFQLHYEVVPAAPNCGGMFTEPEGIITGFMHAGICEYLIQQPRGMRVEVVFTRLGLLRSKDCAVHKIEVFDGKSDDDNLIKRLCTNDDLDEPLTSSSNFMLLRYEYLLGLPVQREFEVRYKRVCDDRFFGPEGGIITTPNYPNPYFDHIACTYDIYGPSGTVVLVNFTDFTITETIPTAMNGNDTLVYENYVEVQLSNSNRKYYKGEPMYLLSDKNHIRIVFHAGVNTRKARGLRIEYDFETMGCGGILIEKENTFSKYGSLLSMPDYCEWIIEAPPGKHISLDLKYQRYGSVCHQSEANLFVYANYTNGDAVLLGSYCGNDDELVEPVHANTVTIILRKLLNPPSSVTYGVFGEYTLINSSSECGGTFSARFGIVKSPNWPRSYSPSSDCIWTISAPMGNQIELAVKNFTLEYMTETCVYDYLEIRNGGSENSPLIGKYCGTSIPSRIPSFSNVLRLHFHSDEYSQELGFYITWQHTKTGCGGKLFSHTGTIHSPYNPEVSGAAASCDWYITVAEGSTIDISVSRMEDSHYLCDPKPTLIVYDGPSPSSHVLPWNCNSSTSLAAESYRVVSTNNRVLVRYLAENDEDDGLQFLLEYKTKCNNVLPNTLMGVIESPNFPESYPPDMSCSWDIRSGRLNKISLLFSHLNVEMRADCDLDYVELIDMRDDVVIKSKRLCSRPDEAIVSEGNRFLIKFISDYSEHESGFRLEYKRLGCGDHLRSFFGSFNTPNSPYSVDLDCDWYIDAPAGKQISLTFLEIHIETDAPNCDQDALVVSEDKNSSVALLRECRVERTTFRVTSPANRLYIHFHSSEKRTRKYFRASYLFVNAVCGGRFFGQSGVITSPNYPDEVSNIECSWEITVDDTFGIILDFTDFNMTQSSNCADASIEIRKLNHTEETIVQERACGPLLSDVVKHTFVQGNNVRINLKVGPNGSAKFALSYKKECGGVVTAPFGFLKAEPYHRCEWSISAPDGALISLDIMHLECPCQSQSNCGLRIAYDSADDERVDLYTCFTNITNFVDDHFLITANTIYFSAKFSTLENTCGGKITSLQGNIASPSHRGTYLQDMECVWEIKANEGNTIELEFVDLDIASVPYCNEDFLEIRADRISGKVLGTYCGNQLPTDTLPAMRSFWLKFKSAKGTKGGTGFKLSWAYAHDNELNGTSGTIVAPPVYAARTLEEAFSWRIFVSRGELITLNLKSYSKGLTIYDGFDETALPVVPQVSPWTYTSGSNVIYLVTTNAELEYFLIAWETVSAKAVAANSTINDCHEDIMLSNDARTTLSSPGYPNGYEDGLNCDWLIRVEDSTMHAVFNLFEANLEDMSECSADYLRVMSSSDLANWKEEAKVCKTQPKTYFPVQTIHGTPNLKLEFKTDASINGTGFTSMLTTACGSNMTSSVGTILDTNLLHARIVNSSCIWNIAVNPGKRIRFTFDFGNTTLRSKNEHCAQYAIIYDGLDAHAPILRPGQICNHPDRNVKVVESTANYAMLKYNMTWSMVDMPRSLWNLTYREFSECDDEIVLTHLASQVNITSPRYPNVPQPHRECNWVVMAPPGESISADFIERFDMNVRFCNKEFVEFHDGSTVQARSLGRFCHRTGTILSTGNFLHVRYLTDTAEPRAGFKLNISIASCGGIFYRTPGEITSKNYPALGAYPKASVCEYTIKTPKKSRIRLNFTDIHLPYDANDLGNSDRIVIETLEENPQQLAVYYGNLTRPSPLDVDTNEVIVRFHTLSADNSRYRGFKLKFLRIQGSCLRELTAESGRIVIDRLSSGINYQTCRWRITVPRGQIVSLQLITVERQSTENGTQRMTPASTIPNVAFFNDYDMLSKITSFDLTTFNGTRLIRSSDNIMLASIRMGQPGNAITKIVATYNSNDGSNCPPDIPMESMKGQISLSSLQAENFYCRLEFKLSSNETITFKIDELQVQRLNTISSQYAVRFRNDDLFMPYSALSNNVSQHLVSLSAKKGSVTLVQTENVRIKAFTASYYRNPCGGSLKLVDGLILDYPNVNAPAEGVLECVWLLGAQNGQSPYRLVGNISFVDSCEREYVALYAGLSTDSSEVARICRDTPTYNGTQLQKRNWLMVYHADDYKPKQSNFRFRIEKNIKCGSKTDVVFFTDPVEVDKKAYVNNFNCIWEFQASPGMALSLHFSGRFFIEDSVNCTKDYLEVRTLGVENPRVAATFCGREVPPIYNSSANHVLVVFNTDAETTGDGFRFTVHSNCNFEVNVTDQTQLLPMPQLESLLQSSVHCVFTFHSESDKMINVRIRSDMFDVNSGSDYVKETDFCEYASFTVLRRQDDPDSTDEEKKPQEFCRNVELRAKNYMQVQYAAILDRGYSIEYDLNTCGGNITTPRAIRTVRHETEDIYIDNMNCVWYVTAPSDHSIVVRFKYFEMEHNQYCRFDYFAVYKGATANEEKRVTKICGNLTAELPEIAVDSNQAVITAISDSSSSARGFLANVLFVPNCNERITLSDGNSPATLTRTLNATEELLCYYRIMAPEGYRVSIQIRELELNKVACQPANCDACNHIELYDSIGAKRISMGKYCENGRSDVKRLSSYEDALIKLSATKPGQYSFEIILQMEPAVCGPSNLFTLRANEVVSLGFPPAGMASYPPNTHCTWRIEVTDDYEIEFQTLQLQNVSQVTGECVDFLRIKGRQQFKTYCGNATGYQVFGSEYRTSYIDITFHSDESIEDKGFNLTVRHRFACNRTYTSLSSMMVYRFASDDALRNQCVDEIRVPDNYEITIYVSLAFFRDSDCPTERKYLKIVDIKTNATLREQCSSLVNTVGIYSNTSAIRVSLHSFSTVRLFYVANLKSATPGCGGQIFSTEGEIINPPYNDRNHSECRWEIIAPIANQIKLNFYSFDMGSITNCHLDYVNIFELQPNGSQKLKRTLCGQDLEERTYQSEGNRIAIVSKKSPNFDGTGWTIQFETREFSEGDSSSNGLIIKR